MATSDLPAVRLDVTDPAEWGTSGWLANIIRHLLHRLFTALADEAFAGHRRRLA